MNTQEKLDRLYELKTAMTEMEERREAEVETILTPELQARVDEIFDKWDSAIEGIKSQMAELESEIKADVLAGKETVKGARLMAVWNKGRVSWDGKKLDGMRALIPQLDTARKVSDPTVTIREAK